MDSILQTARLLLRPPEESDVGAFVPLIGNFRVAKNLSAVPHPYTDADGYRWVADMTTKRANGEDYSFAIIRKSDSAFAGICAVHPERDFEFGYWLGETFWGHGYMTEAARRIVRFAFDELGVRMLSAGYMHDNPVSGRVLAKLGFIYTHDAPYHCVSRREEVLGHRMVLTRERFENVTVTS